MTQKIDSAAFLKALNKWEETAPIEILLNITALKEHMLNENGIKFSPAVWKYSDMVIVDEQKYLMFLLRYA